MVERLAKLSELLIEKEIWSPLTANNIKCAWVNTEYILR
jgi:hypothetical protein